MKSRIRQVLDVLNITEQVTKNADGGTLAFIRMDGQEAHYCPNCLCIHVKPFCKPKRKRMK